jgi:hypothetical protein
MADLSPKTESVPIIITGIVGSLLSVLLFGIAKPVLASEDISFVCKEYDGKPTTYLVTPRVKKPIIQWENYYFALSGYTPEVRCSMVTYNLNKSSSDGKIPVLTTGFMGDPNNLYPVICTTDKKGGECLELLYTLKKDIQDPDETLAKLLRINKADETKREIEQNLLRESKCFPKLYVNIKKNGNLQGKYACEGETGILTQVNNLFNNLASFVQELF